MKRAILKLKSWAGESFSEVLVALLIVALASMLLAAMYSASGSVDAKVKQEDSEFYKEVSAVEAMDATAPSMTTDPTESIEIKDDSSGFNATISVNVYQTDDGTLKSYEKG